MESWLICLFLVCSFCSYSEPLTLPKPVLLFGVSTESSTVASVSNADQKIDIKVDKIIAPLGSYKLLGYQIIPRFSYSKHKFEFSNSVLEDKRLYSAQLPIMAVKPIDDRWTSILQLVPGLQSDEESIDNDVYALLGFAMWNYKWSGSENISFGIGVNRLFGELTTIPMVSYSKRIDEHQSYTLGIPITQYQYGFNNSLSARVFLSPEGNYWRYAASTSEQNEISTKAYFRSFKLGVGIRYRLTGNYYAGLDLAKRVEQRYEFDDFEGNTLDGEVADMTTLKLSLGYFPTW